MKGYHSILMLMALAIGVFVTIAAQDADALFVMALDDPGAGGVEVIVADGSPIGTVTKMGLTTVADAVADGFMNYNGAAGLNFTINVTTGISKPILGGPNVATMDLNSVNVSSLGAGNLDIYLTDTGFALNPPSPPNYLLISEIGGTTNGNVSYAQYVDLANNEFGIGPPPPGIVMVAGGPLGPGAFADSKSTSFALTNPFSLTEHVAIAHAGKGQITSFDSESTVVTPEPGTLLLLGCGLVGIAGYAWRKKRKQS